MRFCPADRCFIQVFVALLYVAVLLPCPQADATLSFLRSLISVPAHMNAGQPGGLMENSNCSTTLDKSASITVVDPFKTPKRKWRTQSKCAKMESSLSQLSSYQKIQGSQFSDTTQSSGLCPVNGNTCSNQPELLKHTEQSVAKCMQPRVCLTDILKTKLGQDYLNRWSHSQHKEMLLGKLGGSSVFSKSGNSRANSKWGVLLSSEQSDFVTASNGKGSPVHSECGDLPTYGTSEGLHAQNRHTDPLTYCKRRGMMSHSQSTQLHSRRTEAQSQSKGLGFQNSSLTSPCSVEDSVLSPVESALSDRSCHKTLSYTLCQEENLSPSSVSSKMRSCSVLLRGHWSATLQRSPTQIISNNGFPLNLGKNGQAIHSLENEDGTSIKASEKVGALFESLKCSNYSSGSEDPSIEVTQKVRMSNSDLDSWMKGQLELGAGTPGTPGVSRKSVLRLTTETSCLASKSIHPESSCKEPADALLLEEESSDVCPETQAYAVEQKCFVNDKPKKREKGVLSESQPYHSPLKKPKLSPPEPIVLSSDEEVEEDAEGVVNVAPIQSPSQSALQLTTEPQDSTSEQDPLEELSLQDETDKPVGHEISQAPLVFQFPFSALHVGRVRVEPNGNIMITAHGITIPLKDPSGKVEVSLALVPSQILRYGVWSCDVLELNREKPPSIFFFLWMRDDAAKVLCMELSPIHPPEVLGPVSPFVLLALNEPLDSAQEGLLGTHMKVLSLNSDNPDLMVSFTWAQGLALIRKSGDAYLLSVLGQDLSPFPDQQKGQDEQEQHPQDEEVSHFVPLQKERPARQRPSYTLCCRRNRDLYAVSVGLNPGSPWSRYKHQGTARRFILFPPPPAKGGISVTTEDLECLDTGKFLNDVIIDFYFKYLILERAPKEIAERSHVFSSFFYKRLNWKDSVSKGVASYPTQHRRHQRVKTWTRNVDIFRKDYLFIPVNQEAHWYLVVICFPGLEKPQLMQWIDPAVLKMSAVESGFESQASDGLSPIGITCEEDGQERLAGGMEGGRETSAHCLQAPECTKLGCQRDTVCRRPCILIMDSLKLSAHERVFKLLREYLEVEWEVRRGTPRDFTPETMSGSHCNVPLQDNSSDCGLYLLQYAESFLENPVVHFDLPLHLEDWFPQQTVRRKREEIRDLILSLYSKQLLGGGTWKS
ncbi:sentrin-specific protease 7-like isoform X3 [Scleropages formosus]|uniref:sentrin-specific protease 7-like isoform X3 n=1 Tax=Scleropages formosus TaxID=113540 RepID=UPI0010FA9F6A|nr:sentrin-specific protease 7-like isoform X3 [Scleropages formosus]